MESNFKLIDGELYCRICNDRVSVKTERGLILTSNSEGDEGKGICHSCLVEHCFNTNCLGCDWYQYPNCQHVETKKTYLEEQED